MRAAPLRKRKLDRPLPLVIGVATIMSAIRVNRRIHEANISRCQTAIPRDSEKNCTRSGQSLKTVPTGNQMWKFGIVPPVSNPQRRCRGHILLGIDTITTFASNEGVPCNEIRKSD